MTVPDASVAVKWFILEADSHKAQDLLRRLEPLVAPDLILAEAANAAWAQLRRNLIGRAQFDALVKALPRTLHEVVPTADVLLAASVIAAAIDHPIYDCIYIALAEARNDILVTADTKLIRKVAGTPWRKRVADLAKF